MTPVLQEHRDRMENDKAYREAALTAPAPVRGKYLTNTAPTKPQADSDAEADLATRSEPQESRPIDSSLAAMDPDSLAGDALDEAVRDADIEGRSEMTADEKREALKNR